MQAMFAALALWMADEAPAKKPAPAPEDAFRRMDANRNGAVTLEEFGEHLKKNPRLKSRQEWEDLFTEIDTDESGALSLEEFKAWAAKAKKKPPTQA